MFKFLLFMFLSVFLYASVEVEGYLAQDSSFHSKKDAKHDTSFLLEQNLKISYEKENISSFLNVFAQEDLSDFTSQADNDRTFLRLDEAYVTYENEDNKILFGKSIRFWGALELSNIVDVFNIEDKRNSPFQSDKIGAYNLELSHYYENSEVSFIVKLYEQNNTLAASSYYYSFLKDNESLSSNLLSKHSKTRPGIYIKYSGSMENYALDYAFIYQNAYDSQRYLSKIFNKYYENIYLVNKYLTYNTLVLGSSLIKMELVYTDVIDDKNVSDYIHSAFGIEHSLESFDNGSELSLLAEYYYYKTLNKQKLNDISLGQIFQNDLFLGLRYALNDISNSSALGGVIIDKEYKEETYYVEMQTRLNDMFKIKAELNYIKASKNSNTIYAQSGSSKSLNFNISYHF